MGLFGKPSSTASTTPAPPQGESIEASDRSAISMPDPARSAGLNSFASLLTAVAVESHAPRCAIAAHSAMEPSRPLRKRRATGNVTLTGAPGELAELAELMRSDQSRMPRGRSRRHHTFDSSMLEAYRSVEAMDDDGATRLEPTAGAIRGSHPAEGIDAAVPVEGHGTSVSDGLDDEAMDMGLAVGLEALFGLQAAPPQQAAQPQVQTATNSAAIAGGGEGGAEVGADGQPVAALHRPCTNCRASRVLCDRQLPCSRCVRLGLRATCQAPPTVKRGRPTFAMQRVRLEENAVAQLVTGLPLAHQTTAEEAGAAAPAPAERATCHAATCNLAEREDDAVCLVSSPSSEGGGTLSAADHGALAGGLHAKPAHACPRHAGRDHAREVATAVVLEASRGAALGSTAVTGMPRQALVVATGVPMSEVRPRLSTSTGCQTTPPEEETTAAAVSASPPDVDGTDAGGLKMTPPMQPPRTQPGRGLPLPPSPLTTEGAAVVDQYVEKINALRAQLLAVGLDPCV